MKRNILNLKNLVYLLIISVFILTGCHYIDEEYKHPEGIFVSVKRGNDANDGSMERPLKTILTALNLAVTRSVRSVLVEEGTYTFGNGLNDNYGVYINNSALVDYSNITLSGGWVSLGKYYFCSQNGTTILDSQNAPNPTQHNSLYFFGDAFGLSNMTIEKFTITGGNISSGGGVYITTANNLKIIDCIIKNNKASSNGGAIIIYTSNNVLIKNCLISNNVSVANGGGIYVSLSSVIIDHCFITNNSTSNWGGAIGLYDCSSVQLKNNIIISNSAGYGGALYIYQGSDIYIENNFFIKNYATISENSTIDISSLPTPPFEIKSNYFHGPEGVNRSSIYTSASINNENYNFINNIFNNTSYDYLLQSNGKDVLSSGGGLNDPGITGILNSSGNIIYNDEINFDWFY